MSTATRKLSDLERKVYGCPDWCQRWDHDAEAVERVEEAWHYADFGPVSIHATGDSTPAASIDYDSWRDLGPAELRTLAESALAAAAWLEELGAWTMTGAGPGEAIIGSPGPAPGFP